MYTQSVSCHEVFVESDTIYSTTCTLSKVTFCAVFSFQDRFADGRALPPIDESQDWFLISGEQDDGFTVLEFSRNLTTCDPRDLEIKVWTSCLFNMSEIINPIVSACLLAWMLNQTAPNQPQVQKASHIA